MVPPWNLISDLAKIAEPIGMLFFRVKNDFRSITAISPYCDSSDKK